MTQFDALLRCTNKENLKLLVGDISKELGFEYFAYSAMVLRGIHTGENRSLHNLPEDLWLAYPVFNKRTTNPIASRSMKEMTPHFWYLSESSLVGKLLPLYRKALRHGVRKGMCVPVHNAEGISGTFTLATLGSSTDLSAVAPLCLLFSKYVYEATERCWQGQARSTPITLSPRETECLSWAAKGKTAWEIGRVMSISEHTAVFHLRNSVAKLGTSTRQQAVAIAIEWGLITTH
jgi:DNA-binding CsgD family transcriptional regulator